jgi:multidrug efflux pump subunit AcrA (membrane-fusion protein)
MRKRIVSLVLIVVMLMVIFVGCSDKTNELDETQETENYTPVEVDNAEISNIENVVNINGKVAAKEEVSIIPKAMGTVTKVNVDLGDNVEVGTVLFNIEQQDIALTVDQASNGVDLAQKSVAQAENGLETARTNYELNKEKIENAQLNLERTRALYEEGAVSKAQLEQAELSASDKNLDVLLSQVTQAEIGYQQSQNQLKQAQISYEQAVNGLSNTVVEAPMKGVVSSLNVKQGQIVGSGQVAATIVDMDTVYVQISVVENVVNKIKEGQEAEISVPAVFDGYIKSTIGYISPTADPMNKLYTVRLYLDNKEYGIRPGMTGSVKLSLDSVDEAIVIKSDAVLDKDGKKIVYIVENDMAVEKEVETGLDTGELIEIISGINQGDSVIIEGQHYVSDGARVKVVRGE